MIEQFTNHGYLFFTCAIQRCLILELVPNCQLITCIRAISRFFTERDVPCHIISDKASQFSSSDTQSVVTFKGIKWSFNLGASPW